MHGGFSCPLSDDEPNPPYVSFVTASPHYAPEGCELDAFDYVVKPVSFPCFLKAVNKAVGLLGNKPAAAPVATPQLLFVKEGNSLQHRLTRFIRIQKSCLVRLNTIKAIIGNEVELYDLPKKIPIGKQYKELLMRQFGLN